MTNTRDTVLEFLDRLATRSPAEVAALFADEVDWQLNWPAAGDPAVPWIRPRSTRADVADHFAMIRAHHAVDPRPAQAPTILTDGADAVVLTVIRQTVRATGAQYSARCALHLTVVDDRITRYHVYEDSLTVHLALSGRPERPAPRAHAG